MKQKRLQILKLLSLSSILIQDRDYYWQQKRHDWTLWRTILMHGFDLRALQADAWVEQSVKIGLFWLLYKRFSLYRRFCLVNALWAENIDWKDPAGPKTTRLSRCFVGGFGLHIAPAIADVHVFTQVGNLDKAWLKFPTARPAMLCKRKRQCFGRKG